MLKKRVSFILLLCFCFSNFSIDFNFQRNKELKISRNFVLGNLAFASLSNSESTQSGQAQTEQDEDKFDVQEYITAYNNSIQTVYDKFEKAYKLNQTRINRLGGFINQRGYEKLVKQQIKSEKAFNKAFAEAEITKDGENIEFPEFSAKTFKAIKTANEKLEEWIKEQKELYDLEKFDLDEEINECLTSEPLSSRLESET